MKGLKYLVKVQPIFMEMEEFRESFAFVELLYFRGYFFKVVLNNCASKIQALDLPDDSSKG